MNDLNLESAVDTLRWLREKAEPEESAYPGGPAFRTAVLALRRALLVAAERASAEDRKAVRDAVIYYRYPGEEEYHVPQADDEPEEPIHTCGCGHPDCGAC